ncbi:VP5 [Bercke-Baary Melophagus reo-like virus]|nr:VP5 [Bercke-Baary Melophagus reo-like virus]UJG27949.1 VP5 [Bercke-Baary Melophagus reo-like virus]
MSRPLKFTSLSERKRYYANSKFGPVNNTENVIEKTRAMTHQEYHMLQAVSQTVEDEYAKLNGDELIKIPYFTNNVNPVNIFKENKSPTGNDHGLYLNDILRKMITSVLEYNDYNIDCINFNNVLLHLQYPIEKEYNEDGVNLIFDSMVVENDGYLTVKINDVILYAMVKDCSKHFMMLSAIDDIYLIGSDIALEDYMLSRSEFDSYFITLTKTIFSTTLIGRNVDQLGLMDYPSYQFSLGTYSLNNYKNNKFIRTMASHSLIHVLPLWDSVFKASFLLELTTTDVEFSYQHDTMFAHYERDILTRCFKQVSDRTENIMAVPVNVSISTEDDSMRPIQVYNANIKVRNKLSMRLNDIKNFNKIKDRMFPKDKYGAKTKLQYCLSFLNITNYRSVLDIGSAPGTWLEHLMTYDHFTTITGVTRWKNKVDLPMYLDVLKKIENDSRASITFDDALSFLEKSEKHDLIVSDLATKYNNYLTQSVDHDYLYTKLLDLIVGRLYSGGSFIMKMYDLTEKMHESIIKILDKFNDFKIIKPNGSCLTNPEIYIIGINYQSNTNNANVNHVNHFNQILISQICNLNKLLTQGFGLQVNYNLFNINNRMKLTNIEYLPDHLALCLSYLKFSEYLYPVNLTGTMYDEITLLGDRYLRIYWDVPKVPESHVRYITETSIGYEANGIGLQQLFITHHGFIVEDGLKKYFFILEKESSCLFSDKYDVTCIVSAYSRMLPDNQFTIPMLLSSVKFQSLFPGVYQYNQLEYYVKQLSLSKLLELQQFYNTVSSTIILNQFFRESETMHLFYAKNQLYTNIKRSKKQRTFQTIDLSKNDDRKIFVEIYKAGCRMGKTLRQVFLDMLNEYTFKIWKSELLTTALCTTKRTYIEYKTGQICVSQPACVQLRRQMYLCRI